MCHVTRARYTAAVYTRRPHTHSLGSILDSEGSDGGGGSDTLTLLHTHAHTQAGYNRRAAESRRRLQRRRRRRRQRHRRPDRAVCNSPRERYRVCFGGTQICMFFGAHIADKTFRSCEIRYRDSSAGWILEFSDAEEFSGKNKIKS